MKEKKNPGSARPGSLVAWVAHNLGRTLLGSRAAWVAHDLGEKNPGSASPRSRTTQAARCMGYSDVLSYSGFFFFFSSLGFL